MAYWVQELAKRLDVKEEAVRDELSRIREDGPAQIWNVQPGLVELVQAKSRKDILAERIASLVIKSPRNISLIDQDCLSCLPGHIQTILADLRQEKSLPETDFTNYLYLKAEAEEDEQIDCDQEIKICLREISNLEVKNKMNGISKDIKKAEGEKDANKVSDLIQKFKEVAGKLVNS